MFLLERMLSLKLIKQERNQICWGNDVKPVMLLIINASNIVVTAQTWNINSLRRPPRMFLISGNLNTLQRHHLSHLSAVVSHLASSKNQLPSSCILIRHSNLDRNYILNVKTEAVRIDFNVIIKAFGFHLVFLYPAGEHNRTNPALQKQICNLGICSSQTNVLTNHQLLSKNNGNFYPLFIGCHERRQSFKCLCVHWFVFL